jgi:hypothetical protein
VCGHIFIWLEINQHDWEDGIFCGTCGDAGRRKIDMYEPGRETVNEIVDIVGHLLVKRLTH